MNTFYHTPYYDSSLIYDARVVLEYYHTLYPEREDVFKALGYVKIAERESCDIPVTYNVEEPLSTSTLHDRPLSVIDMIREARLAFKRCRIESYLEHDAKRQVVKFLEAAEVVLEPIPTEPRLFQKREDVLERVAVR